MATSYVLNVEHQGTSCGDFCIFQTYEDQDEDIRSLVWFNKTAHPGTRLQFDWQPESNSCPGKPDALSKQPRYWIASGNFKEGEAIDPGSIAQKYEIRFEENQNEKTIRFTENNTWEEVEWEKT